MRASQSKTSTIFHILAKLLRSKQKVTYAAARRDWRVVVSLSCFAYHKMLCLLPKSKVGGIPGPEAYQKNNTPNVDACAQIHFQMKISDSSASTNPKKARFSSYSIFKLHSSNSIFKLPSSNSIFKLSSSNSIFKTALFKFYLDPTYRILASEV